MAKYSELGNVKFTLRIVAQFLCGQNDCGPALARMILWAGSGQNDCGTTVAPWLNLTFLNLF